METRAGGREGLLLLWNMVGVNVKLEGGGGREREREREREETWGTVLHEMQCSLTTPTTKSWCCNREAAALLRTRNSVTYNQNCATRINYSDHYSRAFLCWWFLGLWWRDREAKKLLRHGRCTATIPNWPLKWVGSECSMALWFTKHSPGSPLSSEHVHVCNTYTCMHTHTHTPTHPLTHSLTHTHTHSHTHVNTHTLTHTCKHRHSHLKLRQNSNLSFWHRPHNLITST